MKKSVSFLIFALLLLITYSCIRFSDNEKFSCYEDHITVSENGIAVINGRQSSYLCDSEGANYVVDSNTNKINVIPHEELDGDIKTTRNGKYYLLPSLETILRHEKGIYEVDIKEKTKLQEVNTKGYLEGFPVPLVREMTTFLDNGDFLIGSKVDNSINVIYVDTNMNEVTERIEIKLNPKHYVTGYHRQLKKIDDKRYYLYYNYRLRGEEVVDYYYINTMFVEIDLSNMTASELGSVYSKTGRRELYNNYVFVKDRHSDYIFRYSLNNNGFDKFEGKLKGATMYIHDGIVFSINSNGGLKRNRYVSWDASTMEELHDKNISITNAFEPGIAGVGVQYDYLLGNMWIINEYGKLSVVDIKRGEVIDAITYRQYL